MARDIPKYVRDFAARHALDLSKVAPKATGALSLVDVAEHARRERDGDLWAAAISAQFDWNRGGSGDETALARDRALAAEDALIDGLACGRYTTTNGREPGEWSK